MLSREIIKIKIKVETSKIFTFKLMRRKKSDSKKKIIIKFETKTM